MRGQHDLLLLTIGALHARPITRLGAVLADMAKLIAILALHNTLVGAVRLAMSRLLAVEANLLDAAGAVLAEVTDLVAVLALNTLGRTLLCAVLVVVLKRATVLATVAVDLAGSGAVTSQVALAVTVVASEDDLARALVLLLLASVAEVTWRMSVQVIELARRQGQDIPIWSQLRHFSTKPSMTKPLLARRSVFSSGVSGQPSRNLARRGLVENWNETTNS